MLQPVLASTIAPTVVVGLSLPGELTAGQLCEMYQTASRVAKLLSSAASVGGMICH